jgi:hypothetical protein
MLVGAHPLHAHRSTHLARQQRGVGGRILVPIASVAARAVDVDHSHVRIGHTEHQRQLLAQVVRGLARRPAGELAPVERCDRAGRADGTMRVNGKVIGGGQSFVPCRERCVHIATIAGHVVFGDLGGTHVVPQLVLVRKPLPIRPAGFELSRAADGAPFGLSHDRKEIPPAYHSNDARHAADVPVRLAFAENAR